VYVYIPNDGGYPFAQFTPQVITVVIGVNNTVVWTNQDVLVHDILTATGLPGFASGDLLLLPPKPHWRSGSPQRPDRLIGDDDYSGD
jgi:plastocyanin